MAYTTTVEILNLEGGGFPSATGRLWMLWTVLGRGTGSGQQQQDQEDQTVQTDASNRFTLTFNHGPDNRSSSRQIGLSIQDTNRVGNNTGWWFRSSSFEVLPNENIEVILASQVNLTQAQVDSSLPAMPMTVDASTTVTSATAMLQDDGSIDLVADGTTTAAGPSVNFNYRLKFKLVPSSSIASAETDVLDIETNDRGSITFSGPGVGVTTTILNAVSSFVLQQVFPQFRARLKSAINVAVISQIASRIAPGTTTLPAGVIVSVRSINTTSAGVAVRAALGAFGGVISKFPPISTAPDCPIKKLGTPVLLAVQLNVFRLFRDMVLVMSPPGRKLVRLYYKHSSEVTRIVLGSPSLAERSTALIIDLQGRFQNRTKLDRRLIEDCRCLALEIAERGSAQLRTDIASCLTSVEENGYFGLITG